MELPESGNVEDLVRYRIDTAKSDLKSAQILIREREYRGANNRAYYAIYHVISAVLALDGKSYKRHKDTLANYVLYGSNEGVRLVKKHANCIKQDFCCL